MNKLQCTDRVGYFFNAIAFAMRKIVHWVDTPFISCAVMMLAGVAVIAANALGWISEEVFTRYHLTFWMETLAVEAFGFSWLVKGGTVFPDLPMSPV